MLQMFIYKMGNFYKKNFRKKLFTLGAKRKNTLKKGGPQRNGFFGGPPFLFHTPES